MSTSLTFDEVVPTILETVKGLRFEPNFDDYELQFVVVEDYLVPHLVSEGSSPEDRNAGFALMQRMVESDDPEVRGLLDVGIMEGFEVAWIYRDRPGLSKLLAEVPPTLDLSLRREFPERWPKLLFELGLTAN